MRRSTKSLQVVAALLLGTVVATCGPRAATGNSAAEASSAPAIAEPILPTLCTFTVRKSYPHDPKAFTEGLLFDGGQLYESTGMVGQSGVRRVRLSDGKVLQQAVVPPPYFGEGLTKLGNEMFSVTWKEGKGFRWNARTFRKTGEFSYTGEGWGLTNDGKQIFMSDGTPVVRVLDPKSMKVVRTFTVNAGGQPVANINELEWRRGALMANVWTTNQVVIFDPASGAVRSVMDLSELRRQAGGSDVEAVPNGIAYDEAGDRLFVTGKYWTKLFEIVPSGC
ncbi:glutaminyl-peptide cyclotransferase [Sphingomonas piscis]|uniref:Glutaminyl-peptide cyclotransferase n=1 Tax=Sphingomonas piscis TaxID=2714943 RepID=A0A6G7YN07_9SPHN|nr:glutaminyl-peptide cyclotransferase [Sphingomonas piscis]QIK78130.1 glutaminyl-peptide cyclotransferase [Sphingomonas piscis]